MKLPFQPFLLLFCAPLAAADGFRAGAARIDITPEAPIRLSGYASREAVHEGIEGRLHARALVLEDASGVLTAILSVDAIGIPARLREHVVYSVRGRTGIYHVRIMIGATHTHYAPILTGNLPNLCELTPEESAAARAYTDSLGTKLVKAIDEALGKLAPAVVRRGKGAAGFGKNRRTPGGPDDPQVDVLLVEDLAQKPIAVVFNYACHATTMNDLNRVCGDWPGFAAEGIESAHPGAIALPLIGCGADQNPHPRGDLALARAHGRELALAVSGALRAPMKTLPPRTDAQLEYLPLRFAHVPGREELEAMAATGPEHVRRNARRQLERLARDGRLPETCPLPVQVLSFGDDDLVMVFLGGEVVVDYAIRLRAELPAKDLWITAYANDVPGYIASRRVLGEGGYEADGSMVWYGQPSRWDDSVEETVIGKLKSMIESGSGGVEARVRPPPPKSPEEALGMFRLPPGLRIEIAAAEPDVTDPVAIAFDERGRMYVAEMRDYPLGPPDGKPFDGRVQLLEDMDGDGRFERSTTLADNVPYASGITCANGGVYVTAVPDILFLQDTDGDGSADIRRVVYSGFAPGNSQHIVNTLERSLDNWIHGNGGDSATVRSLPPLDAADVQLRASNFRFEPRTLRFEAASGYHGGFGVTFDSWGSRFVCDNQTPLVHVVFEREDLGRNPDLRIHDATNEITAQGVRVYPVSRPLERFNDPQDYNRFSSACGVHVFGGDKLPAEYRGSIFISEPVSNLVHRDVLIPSGASYTARRGEKDSEFLASADHWFRPVNCATGPDGALYVVDMYRQVIEHPEWIPGHMQRVLDLKGGMDRGRIYRVTGEAVEPSPRGRDAPDLGALGPGDLARELTSPNAWRRGTAQRLLVERRDAASAPLVRAVLRGGAEPTGRVHALWTLEGLDALGVEDVRAALQDAAPTVRAQAAILARRFPALGDELGRHADDSDARVRFQTALALGVSDSRRKSESLIRIALRDSADPWTRTAVLVAGVDLVPLVRALQGEGLAVAGRPELLHAALALAGSRRRSAEVVSLLGLLTDGADASRRGWQIPAVAALLVPLGPGGFEKLAAGERDGPSVQKQLDLLFKDVAERTRDEALDLRERVEAIDLLAFDAAPSTRSLLRGLLDARLPLDVQSAAAGGLARSTSPEAATLLIEAFRGLTPRIRGDVLDALVGDPARLGKLLDALEDGRILPADIDLVRRRLLLESPVEDLRRRAAKALENVAPDADRSALVERYRAELRSQGPSSPADLREGEELFVKACSVCHRMGDKGVPVGADLSGMASREVDALLVDILDPSRAVAPEFLNYVCVRKDGQVVTGLLASETPVNIVLRRAEGKVETVLRRDIEELRSTGQSVMPEGLEGELNPRQLRNVIAFIRGEKGAGRGVEAPAGGGNGPSEQPSLRGSLTFLASFDSGPDADLARGDPRVYTAKELGADPSEGLKTGNVSVVKEKGRHGGALEFRKKDPLFVLYRAEKNVAYRKEDWSGTVSVWLRLDPDRDLEPGYCDPINITQRGWNDGALFVDFTKDDTPRRFRLGVFADRKVWDPTAREWDDVPVSERPMVEVAKPPFGRDRWTHVCFTWSSFNTGKDDGVAAFYLDGKLQGKLEGRRQTFTWDPSKAVLHAGMYFVGLLDELAVFDRALAEEEVLKLYGLEGGLKALLD